MNRKDKQSITGRIFIIFAVAWACFQLMLPEFLLLDRIAVRAIHLSFAVSLVFLLFPRKRPGKGQPVYGEVPRKSAIIPLLLVSLCIGIFLYIILDWDGISSRSGMPVFRDILFGIIAMLLLLEAGRRSIGLGLPCVVVGFIIYGFAGPYLPAPFGFKGITLTRLISQSYLSTEGIYGIPLGVSASIVYLFVLFGNLLERAGGGDFFIKLSLSLMGRMRGGAAKAAVFSSGLLGMVSGSSVANVVTTGNFTIPLMKKVGYPARKAAAIEVAASTNGQLMPPIMGAAAFIIAEYVGVSYLKVIKAAIIPAFISYFALFFITHLEAKKLGIFGLPREEIPSFSATLKRGFYYLIPLLVLLIELIYLRHSPSLAAFRAICTLLVIIVIKEFAQAWKRECSIKTIVYSGVKNSLSIIADGFVRGSRNMIPVAIATALAGVIVGVVNMGIGSMITQVVEILSAGNVILLLLITAVTSILLGVGLPTTATYIVMASLTAPIIIQLGAEFGLEIPLLGAHLFCFYFGILADDTPPVGLAAYAAAAIAESDPVPTGIQGFYYDFRTVIIPFVFIVNSRLLLHRIFDPVMILVVFSGSLAGMFAFTAFLQGWFVRKNRVYETMLLLVSSCLLFFPDLIGRLFGITPDSVVSYFVFSLPGFGLLSLVWILQKVFGHSLKV
jgi:TRAP transporter 4TM/12TM fusion protein